MGIKTIMGYIFKPAIKNGVSFNNQLIYPNFDFTISDKNLKYFESIQYKSTIEIETKNTGFISRTIKLDSANYYMFTFTFNNKSSTSFIDQIRTLIRMNNVAGVYIIFNDFFVTGTISSPNLFYCKCINVNFADNDVLFSSGSMNMLASEPYTYSEEIDEYQKVINIPPSTLQWDLQINNVSVLHEYDRMI
jgi:hypothetical protein